MRRLSLLSLAMVAATAAAAGCGEEPAPTPRPPVQLAVTAPRDTETTREATIVVSGTVSPARARVVVLGEPVAVDGGSFSTTIELREGPNVVDVGASAAGRRAVWRAVRVTRRSLIRLPDLVGREEDDARSALDDLGLDVEVTNDDDFFDALRRGPRRVCLSTPAGGTEVSAGTEVEIVVSRSC